jgi:replicative DNA helicase
MLQRQDFLLTCQEIVKPEYFEDKILIWFYQTMINFYQKTKEQPTLSPVLSNELRKAIQNNEIRISEKDKYIEVLSLLKNAVFSPEYIANELVNFCRRQETKKVMLSCAAKLDSASDTDWDDFITSFRNAVKLGSGKSKNLMEYWSSIEERAKYRDAESGRRVIPTGIPPLDAKLNGGLIEGQLGCWLASTGVGKSVVLPFCGKTAVEMGYRVLHFTLELNQNEVAQRYDANWSDIPVHDLMFRKEDVVRNLTNKSNWLLEKYNFNDNLRIQFYPTGTATVSMLEADIRNFIASGWVPDLIIVDYGDLMKPTTNYNDEYADLGRIFIDLRGLAGTFRVPIWTACLTGDTLVDTPSGQHQIKDLVGKKDFPVYCYDRENQKVAVSTIKECWLSNPCAPIWKVTLDNGAVVRGTPTHPFMLRDGTYCRMSDLKPGVSLMPFTRKIYTYGSTVHKQLKHPNTPWPESWIYESHLCAAWKYGRSIEDNEVVHHIDGNHLNDDLDNLEIVDRSDHIRYHRLSYNPMSSQVVMDKMSATKKAQKLKAHNRRSECVEDLLRAGTEFVFKYGELSSKKWDDVAKSDHTLPSRSVVRRLFGTFVNFRSQVSVHNHRVVSVEPCGFDAPVYNLEVNIHHNYALSCGVFVKNTQTNRSAMSLEVVDMDTIGDSWKKAQISDVILTLCRNKEEYEQNIIRVFGAKNRNGNPNWIIKIPTAFDKMRFFDIDTWSIWNKTKSHLDKMSSTPPPPLPTTPLNVIPTVVRRKPKVNK